MYICTCVYTHTYTDTHALKQSELKFTINANVTQGTSDTVHSTR